MEILRTIALYCQSKDLPFIVIGGHAINSYGLDRHTGDIDLLVPRSAKPQWLELMKELRYLVGQNTDVFARFRPANLAAWPIDLMFVDDDTFLKMLKDSKNVEFGLVQAPVASIHHLVALKMHALKQPQAHREVKDFSDLLFLICRSNLTDSELKSLCERYASIKLFERLKGALSNG